MKTRLTILLVALAVGCPTPSFTQPSPAAQAPPEQGTNAPPAAEANDAGDKILLIASEDPPLEVIKTLSEQAQLNVDIDPRILSGQDANGQPIPNWHDATSVRWQNVSAKEALEDFLSRYQMHLAKNPDGRSWHIGYEASETKTSAPGALTTSTNGASGEPLIPIHIEDQAVMDAIATLAQQAKINFQFDPKVAAGIDLEGKPAPSLTNTISVKWEKVTARQALDSLLENYNLMMQVNTNTGIARVTFKPPAAQEPLLTKVIALHYANPTNITSILTTALDTRSKITNDVRTSSLIIKATERDFEVVQAILTRLDLPTREVLIEAKLLETSHNPTSVKGVDWTSTLTAQNVAFGNGITSGQTTTTAPGAATTTATTTPGGRPVSGITQLPFTTATALTTAIGAGGVSADTARGLFPSVGFLSADGLKVALSFLNNDSDTEVVATPTAVTLDNETAHLAVTRLYPNYQITPGSANVPGSALITYTNLGTTLEVTPRIASSNQVSLKVIPEVGNVDSVDRKVVSGTVNEANIYAIRRIETRVLIPSATTLVMGGLISDNNTKTFIKVPVLGDIPGIGFAFRKESRVRSKSNLLIFITPTIVEDNDFQPTHSDFLQTKPRPLDDKPESAWNSGKPYDWKSGLQPINR